MHNELGLYYYPNPAEPKSRVYVREGVRDIEYRLWHADHPEVWEKHGWIPQAALEAAAAMYKQVQGRADPMALYDKNVARALIQEETRRRENS